MPTVQQATWELLRALGVRPVCRAWTSATSTTRHWRTGRPDELSVAVKQAFTAAKGPHMIIVDIAPGVRLGG